MKMTQCEMIAVEKRGGGKTYIAKYSFDDVKQEEPPTVANPDTPTDKGEENGNS